MLNNNPRQKGLDMYSTASVSDLRMGACGAVIDLTGLYGELAKLRDKRQARGKRYGLALVLLLVVLAKLCGEDRPYGIAQWLEGRASRLIAFLGLPCRCLPSHNTYRRVLGECLEVKQLQRVVCRFLRGRSAGGGEVLISMDGKTLRGSLTPGGARVHILAAYMPTEGVVLAQVAVDSTENELSAAPHLLQCLDLRGKVVVGDAIFTQRQLSVRIVRAGGEYIWLAKDNQPRLREAIVRLFLPQASTPGWGLPANDFQKTLTHNKAHGRLEQRILTSSELLNAYLDWPHVAQVFRLERHRTHLRTGIHETEVVYGLTSLTRQEANPSQLLALVRNYWGIENGLYHRRDATLREDATRMTKPTFAQTMAVLNNLVIGLVLRAGWRYLPQARRYYDAHPEAALNLLL